MSNLSTLFDRYKALVVFDTETSGLDFDNDQIIELAALRVERTATGGLRIAGKMDTFIKLPEGETLPENIVSLTGITDERLQTEGVQPVKAAGQIAKLRYRAQRSALRNCRKLIHHIELAHEILSGFGDDAFAYWAKMAAGVKNQTAKWYKTDKERAAKLDAQKRHQ